MAKIKAYHIDPTSLFREHLDKYALNIQFQIYKQLRLKMHKETKIINLTKNNTMELFKQYLPNTI